VVTSFFELIYTEVNVILWAVCLMWSIKRFEQTGSPSSAVAAMISTQFLLYYKEVAPLLLLGFTLGRLLLRCRNVARPGWDRSRLRDPHSRLDICLAAMVVPFALYYLAAMYPNYRSQYVEIIRLPLAEVLQRYLKLDLLVWVFVAVVSVRMTRILTHRAAAPSPLWDGMALGAVGYVAGFLYLRLYSPYYLAPVDLIAVLYLGRLVFHSLEDMGAGAKAGVAALLVVVALQDLLLSAFLVYERKNDLGRAIKGRYESDKRDVRLFFPASRPYWIMEFASYLGYLGVPVERLPLDPVATTKVRIVGRTVENDGRCMGYRDFACHPGSSPEPGDLIVVLPDDCDPAEQVDSPAQRGGEDTLLSYAPRPPIPRGLRPYVNQLHVGFFCLDVPDRWLDASLTVLE
jgi:hypothetical protein